MFVKDLQQHRPAPIRISCTEPKWIRAQVEKLISLETEPVGALAEGAPTGKNEMSVQICR